MYEHILHINSQDKTRTLQNIEEAIRALFAFGDEIPDSAVIDVLETIRIAMKCGDRIIVPIELPQPLPDAAAASDIQPGGEPEMPEEGFRIRLLGLKNGLQVFAAFTDQEEVQAGEETSTITEELESYLEKALINPEVAGVLLNPWTQPFYLSKNQIETLFRVNLPEKVENLFTFQTMDITQSETACIVNSAHPTLLGGGHGVDSAIHRAAGPGLLEECRKLGGCPVGEARITGGYDLKAPYIIHAVGPRYTGSEQDARLLWSCYWNALELARQHGLHSIAFPAISTGVYGYPLEEAAEIAMKTVSDWVRIHPRFGMAVLFACYDEKTTGLYRRVWSRHQEDWNQRPIPRGNDGLLEKALRFALDHAETSRDADRPALLHALQTLQLLASMNADNGLLAAGVLCDLPRQGVPLLDLYEQFGPDVAALVHALEQRGRSWYTGRLMEVTDLPNRPIREKMLVLAEKTAALKQMAADYSQLSDELWKGFELPKEMLSWYYSKLNDGLEELADHPETAGVYWEMTALFKDLFVTFYLDEEEGLIWQISMNGERRMLRRGRLRWGPMEQELTENARPLHRKAAERIEDNWSDEFWAVVERDCADGFYDLFSSESRSLLIEIHEGELIFHAEDRGDACKAMNGERAYDFHYALDADNTRRLMMELRIRYGLKEELPVILRAAFGSEDGPVSFRAFCDEAGVRVQTISF